MKAQGYGKGYRYAHDFPGNFVRMEYAPEEVRGKVYYKPTENGGEKKIHDRLGILWPERYRKS
jgi:putative ATPase